MDDWVKLDGVWHKFYHGTEETLATRCVHVTRRTNISERSMGKEIEQSYKKRKGFVSRATERSSSSAMSSKTTTDPDHEALWFRIRRKGFKVHKVFKISQTATLTHCGKIVNNDNAMFPRRRKESKLLKEEQDICVECSNHMDGISPWDEDVKDDIAPWE